MVKPTPVGAHYGWRDWLAQRVTAVLMLLYTLFMGGLLLWRPPHNYADWKLLFSGNFVRIVTMLFLLALFVLRYFHLLKSWKDVRRKIDRLLGRRRVVQYALAQAQVLELEVERCATAQEFWAVFEHTIRRVGFVEEGEVENEVTLEVRYNGSTPWRLHAPRAKGTTVEWQRIAECFRPIYARAREKWPG